MEYLKIGELAARAGLTVRTLHHYDRLGLLTPAHRTEGGFRLYGGEEVARLQRILALKKLGCTLAEALELLRGGGAVTSVLERQIAALKAQAERSLALVERLALLKARLDASGTATTTELLEILELMSLSEKYFTVDELKALGRRRREAGAALEWEWRALIDQVGAAAKTGVEVSSAQGQELADAWLKLVRQTTGGDGALAQKLKAFYAGEARVRKRRGMNEAVTRWITAALESRVGRTGGEGAVMGSEYEEGHKPSAYRVALLRAFHQTEERPPVFTDPLAAKIIGAEGRAELASNPEGFRDRLSAGLRVSLAVRARLAEEEFDAARGRGVRQLVVLGAGLDTYSYRRPPGEGERFFEVDLAGTQVFKRKLLAAEAIDEPPGVVYVAADFERSTLRGMLGAAGFDFGEPAYFSWLGVTMYLDEEAVAETLALVASLPKGSGIVFDYLVEMGALNERERGAAERLMKKLAARGEPWKTSFAPQALAEKLRGLGFGEVRDYGPDELNERYLAGRGDGLRKSGVTRLAQALR